MLARRNPQQNFIQQLLGNIRSLQGSQQALQAENQRLQKEVQALQAENEKLKQELESCQRAQIPEETAQEMPSPGTTGAPKALSVMLHHRPKDTRQFSVDSQHQVSHPALVATLYAHFSMPADAMGRLSRWKTVFCRIFMSLVMFVIIPLFLKIMKLAL